MEIKDYILFYVNGQARFFVFDDESITNGFLDRYKKDYPDGEYAPLLTLDNFVRVLYDGYKLVLRPLSDMTEEERLKYGRTIEDNDEGLKVNWPFESFRLLCKDGWDLFGLIPAGLAIDKTSLKK